MTKQKASGNIVIDSISTLDMTMKSGSSYTGTINGDNSAKSIKLTLDKKSKIKLTGDSYVTSLDDADTDYSNIDFNGYTLYVNGTAINKQTSLPLKKRLQQQTFHICAAVSLIFSAKPVCIAKPNIRGVVFVRILDSYQPV